MRKAFYLLGTLIGLAQLVSCASVQEMVSAQKPQVEFIGAKITGLSFDHLDLLFDLQVSNPNVIGITLAGFDYDFLINDHSFVQGNQDRGITIESQRESTVQIPVSMQFAEIYNVFQGFGNRDSTNYEIKTGFSFDVPILGPQRIPVSKAGTIPLLKLPSISVASLKLNSLKFTGADLQLNLKVDNPNAFAFNMDAIRYQFDVNQSQWLSGDSKETSKIGAKAEGNLAIPISLNFLQIGRSAYQLLNGNNPLEYHLKGDLDLGTSIPLLGNVTLPFDRSGEIQIIR